MWMIYFCSLKKIGMTGQGAGCARFSRLRAGMKSEVWKFSLLHFSLDFQERYCKVRPCWLCEWASSYEKNHLTAIYDDFGDFKEDKDKINGQIETPVMFSGKPLPTDHHPNGRLPTEKWIAHKVLRCKRICDRQCDRDGDMLLCLEHITALRATSTIPHDGIGCPHSGHAGLCWKCCKVFGVYETLPGDCTMTVLLEAIYARDVMPFQLLFKAQLYDRGIAKDGVTLDVYWSRFKQIRDEHKYCRYECMLNRVYKTTANHSELRVNVQPKVTDGIFLDNFDFILNLSSVHCKQFAEHLLLHDGYIDQRHAFPALKCPLRNPDSH
ncbi:uncharacterized protein LOC129598430 isoform X2 [Paramacrobiotus metropolitanus]|uniref:uncharacterized protein LOC129598430 isoform X2 n=1 Tax=Paramacrobiotus metropolitanus TaxID=2943436 RepID=UPI002445D5E6|nr:uncharacterized protein LOC129598430 isoform X2 [Paramacrobiotus metropolitanus]